MTVDTIERSDTKTESREVPRIYANGKNDDVPGLVAAFKNEFVEYDGHVYDPGENIRVDGDGKNRTIVLSARLIIRGPDAKPIDPVTELARGPYVLVNVSKPLGRNVGIEDCTIEWRPSKEWPRTLPYAFSFADVDVDAGDNTAE